MKFRIKKISTTQESWSQRRGEPFRDNNKCYIWAEGESAIDNLTNRYNRPYKFYQEEILPIILKEVDAKYPEYQISTNVKDWGWRQKCGCKMCGCSPGFIQKTTHGTVTISAVVEFFNEPVADSELV